jgi:deferrochelatase/peroxidase EfeB
VTTLDLNDIQGNILRGYRKRNARHYALVVDSGKDACKLLGQMTSGDQRAAPQVTRAGDWWDRPRACINLGVTAPGLLALGVSESMVNLFPEAFRLGPTRNASGIGDRDASAPDAWEVGGPKNETVHLILSLFTDEARDACLAEYDGQLQALFRAHQLRVVWTKDGYTQDGDKVHFGYRDGIAQPRIKGATAGLREDMQPDCEPGEFLLGNDFTNQFGGNFLGDVPNALGGNGTFAALRVLNQDVPAFEDFLIRAAQRYNLHPELIAAKLMGRWRNGTPLVLAPDMVRGPDDANGNETWEMPTVDEDSLNNFDYAPSADRPAWSDDWEGRVCPVGSHIRRLNPRSAMVMGKPHSRRIIRRGMSYGSVYDPGTAADRDAERGLVGYFICGDLELQFEFLLQVWANMDIATAGMRGTRDPILGDQPDIGGQFVMRTEGRNDPVIFTDLPRLLTTRGSVYVFMPGMQGLKFLSALG